ncbi:MAG: methyltransferase domain-containing protein [Pyrinomonadaceae bacterium]|nr:methyltransferase domain-containing protein [Pyrinomonadaceae bacterium]
MSDYVDLFDSAYGNFAATVLEQVRRETFGEDIGQNSWLTADEYLRFFKWLELKSSSNVLEVACGSGGPALFMARTIGCHILGIDNNENGIATASKIAQEQGLDSQVRFQLADASQPLPFEDELFDSIVCIDAINHFPNRSRVLAEWHRVLKPDGRILFTDPIVVTGLLSNEEIAVRSSIGFFLFAPVGADEKLLKEAGFELIRCEDVTENKVEVSRRWHDARAKWRDDLLKIEGEKTFEGLQQFLSVVSTLSSERRLSRFVFVAHRAT